MSNRTVPATAEGLPSNRRRKSRTLPKALSGLGADPMTLDIVEKYYRLSPEQQQAFRAAVLAPDTGRDPTDEIIAAVGEEAAQPFLDIWEVFKADAAKKAEGAR